MLVGKISGYEDNTRSLERETSEITSLLSQFPGNTNVLVVDTNFTTLLNMKQIMKQYAYQVTIETDAEKALAYLTSCKHEINIVIWDFHMPGIDGLQALKSIGSKMDLPVVIMSDDNQTESVMKATFHGACDYVVKPVKEEVIANIWQHIVRKMLMSKPDVVPPVQSDLAQSDGLDQDKADLKIVDEEPNINEKQLITWTEDIQPFQSDLVQVDEVGQLNDYSKTMNQDNMFNKAATKPRMAWTEVIQPVQSDLVQANDYSQIMNQGNMYNKAAKKPRLTWTEVFQPVQSYLVQTDGLDRDYHDSITINGRQNMEKKEAKKPRKPRMTWTEDLHQKFLEAIEIVGGIEKANPKVLLECLQEMKIEGITRSNVASHLQKHRINVEEDQIPEQTQEDGWSTAYNRPAPSLQGSDNVNTTISPYLMNGRAVNQIQQNQYENGYLTMNNNQFITNPLPPLPYLDHQILNQQYQSPPQLNYLMSNEEPQQASGIYATDLELTYPSLPYDPQEYLINQGLQF
ncbi:unnamed protein product [Arabidopsis halleri]